MPGKHAILSASGASRWMACPPSARLEMGFGESTSVYADEGTLAHGIGELLIRKHLGWITNAQFNDGFYLNKKRYWGLNQHQTDPLYSSEMLSYCEGYAAYVIEKINEEPGSKLYLEKELNTGAYIEEGFCTSDSIILRPKNRQLLCVDLKYGKGLPVSAHENKQGKIYLLGALHDFGWIYDFDTVTFIIYQPRLDSISEYTLSTAELLQWAEEVLKPAAALAFAGQGDYQPGEHCRFCRAKTTCRALRDYNMNFLKMAFADEEKEELKPGPLLSDGEVAEVLQKADLFKMWVGDIEGYAQEQAVKNGKKWPGFKLVEGRSNRRFTDEQKVIEKLVETGYTPDVFMIEKLKTITDLTKILGKLDFETILKDLIIKPRGAPTLVPESDKRPEINNLESVKERFNE